MSVVDISNPSYQCVPATAGAVSSINLIPANLFEKTDHRFLIKPAACQLLIGDR